MARISWLDYTAPNGKPVRGFTWNPAVGCSRATYRDATGAHSHPGCKHCYAAKTATRGCLDYPDDVRRWHGAIMTRPGWLSRPFTAHPPRRDGLPIIGFTHSMSDPCHPNYPEEFWAAVQGAMLLSPWIQWKDFTKRPDRLSVLLCRYPPAACVEAFRQLRPGGYVVTGAQWLSDGWSNDWCHYRHIHRYVSISDQPSADALIPDLLRCPAAIRGVSAEPLVGPVDFTCLQYRREFEVNALTGDHGVIRPLQGKGPRISHVIVGAESGPRLRLCPDQWMLDIVRQCTDAGVPVYVKQTNSTCELSVNPNDWDRRLRIQQHIGLPEGFQ